jgi:PAS domain S-box-containing protein
MKIKASIPVTKKEFITGLWLILFIVSVLLVNRLFSLPVNRTDTVANKITSVDLQITRLKAIAAEFVITYEKKDHLFTTNETKAEAGAKSAFSQLKGDVKYFRAIPYLAGEASVLNALDQLSDRITDYENNLNDFMLAIYERGNEQTGLVSRWQEISNRVLASAAALDEQVISKLNLVKQLEFRYLLTRDLRILEEISVIAEEIRGSLSQKESVIYEADLDSYLKLTGNLIALDKRIGNAETGGVIAGLTNASQDLGVAFDTSRKLISEKSARLSKQWNRSKIIVIGMLTLLVVCLFVGTVRRLVFKPLWDLAGITGTMAGGMVPEDYEASGKLPEIKSINRSIKDHLTFLYDKIAFARAINQKEIHAKLNLAGSGDLLGIELVKLQEGILEAAEKQVINDEENRIRRFMNEGVARFGDILRTGSNNMADLSDAFIRELVKYLNAIQGGFFIFENNDMSAPVLRLMSAFAYNRKKFLQKTVALGEGLVGTCAREKQPINLTEIPTDYINITSGLGDALPNNLLLIPVLHENELIGVLEIASLKKYRDYEITFAREIAGNLGSTIVYTRNNLQTSELLMKSQQQALEMAEQEEEMRQNMEELKATQEESQRREEELSGVTAAIADALFVIEYDLKGTISNVNEKFRAFTGMEHNDIVGRTHEEIFRGEFTPDEAFWENVQKSSQVVFEKVRAGNRSTQLKEHFTAVFNHKNTAVRYINFATDDRTGNS